MRVCLAGSFDPAFGRNRRLVRLLELSGNVTSTARVTIWDTDRVGMVRSGRLKVLLRALLRYPVLVWRLLRVPRPDVFLVSYPGWFDVPVVWAVARVRRVPVVFDVFISLHDTLVEDRRLVPEGSILARVAHLADVVSCRLADRVLSDTPAHADFLARRTGTPRDRFGVVWVGAQDDLFRPMEEIEVDPRLVLFYGTMVPLQGVDVIVRTAKLLAPRGIRFRLIGDGQDRPLLDRLLSELRPDNVEREGMMPLDRLPGEISRAAVILGIFGTSEKATRVIPHKVFEGLAVGRPVVTADTTAIRSAFDETEVAVCLRGDPEALAEVIGALIDDPDKREGIACRGLNAYRSRFHESVLAPLLDQELRVVLGV